MRLAAAARLLADDRGRFPHIGDDDGGRLLPTDGRACRRRARSLCAIAARAARSAEPCAIGPLPEEALWLLAQPMLRAPLPAGTPPARSRRTSAALRRNRLVRVAQRVRAITSSSTPGPHGYLNGGHAHADALVADADPRRPPAADRSRARLPTRWIARDPRPVPLDAAAQHADRGRPPAVGAGGPFHWAHAADAHLGGGRRPAASTTSRAPRRLRAAAPPAPRRRARFRGSPSSWTPSSATAATGPTPLARRSGLASGRPRRDRVALQHGEERHAWLLSRALPRALPRRRRERLGWCSPAYGRVEPTPDAAPVRAARGAVRAGHRDSAPGSRPSGRRSPTSPSTRRPAANRTRSRCASPYEGATPTRSSSIAPTPRRGARGGGRTGTRAGAGTAACCGPAESKPTPASSTSPGSGRRIVSNGLPSRRAASCVWTGPAEPLVELGRRVGGTRSVRRRTPRHRRGVTGDEDFSCVVSRGFVDDADPSRPARGAAAADVRRDPPPGPGRRGRVRGRGAALGMRRLSIIDLATGHQPIVERGRDGLARLQRRDLQLPRAAARAASARVTPSPPPATPR